MRFAKFVGRKRGDIMDKLTRPAMVGISICLGVLIIGILTLVLPNVSDDAAITILDYQSTVFHYPFTIQNLMYIMFSIGFGELFLRWQTSKKELSYVGLNFLPEDDRTMLQSHDLAPIRQKIIKEIGGKGSGSYLPNMINRCILQFQASRSVDQSNSILNSMEEIYSHQIDLKYTILRYIAWAIPTIGFIGTVVGIASALAGIKSADVDMVNLTATLGIAFNTTLVALVLSAILVFFIHIVQEQEEKSLNNAMEYCLINLINRLYVSD